MMCVRHNLPALASPSSTTLLAKIYTSHVENTVAKAT